LGNLVFGQFQLLLQHFELPDGLFCGVGLFGLEGGGIGGLGGGSQAETQSEDQDAERSLH
jgi:hypothetical protein